MKDINQHRFKRLTDKILAINKHSLLLIYYSILFAVFQAILFVLDSFKKLGDIIYEVATGDITLETIKRDLIKSIRHIKRMARIKARLRQSKKINAMTQQTIPEENKAFERLVASNNEREAVDFPEDGVFTLTKGMVGQHSKLIVKRITVDREKIKKEVNLYCTAVKGQFALINKLHKELMENGVKLKSDKWEQLSKTYKRVIFFQLECNANIWSIHPDKVVYKKWRAFKEDSDLLMKATRTMIRTHSQLTNPAVINRLSGNNTGVAKEKPKRAAPITMRNRPLYTQVTEKTPLLNQSKSSSNQPSKVVSSKKSRKTSRVFAG
jgi:hypothetical protein